MKLPYFVFVSLLLSFLAGMAPLLSGCGKSIEDKETRVGVHAGLHVLFGKIEVKLHENSISKTNFLEASKFFINENSDALIPTLRKHATAIYINTNVDLWLHPAPDERILAILAEYDKGRSRMGYTFGFKKVEGAALKDDVPYLNKVWDAK